MVKVAGWESRLQTGFGHNRTIKKSLRSCHSCPHRLTKGLLVIPYGSGHDGDVKLHLIYTETRMLLSKKHYGSWREIQDEYPDYKTSLGPWNIEESIEFLAQEYSDMAPCASEQVRSLIDSSAMTCEIRFYGERDA